MVDISKLIMPRRVSSTKSTAAVNSKDEFRKRRISKDLNDAGSEPGPLNPVDDKEFISQMATFFFIETNDEPEYDDDKICRKSRSVYDVCELGQSAKVSHSATAT